MDYPSYPLPPKTGKQVQFLNSLLLSSHICLHQLELCSCVIRDRSLRQEPCRRGPAGKGVKSPVIYIHVVGYKENSLLIREYYVIPLRSTPSLGTCDRSILPPFPLPTLGLLRFQASVGEAPFIDLVILPVYGLSLVSVSP